MNGPKIERSRYLRSALCAYSRRRSLRNDGFESCVLFPFPLVLQIALFLLVREFS